MSATDSNAEPHLIEVTVAVCEPCIRREGQECHTPGCALWMHNFAEDGDPTVPIGKRVLLEAGHVVLRDEVWR